MRGHTAGDYVTEVRVESNGIRAVVSMDRCFLGAEAPGSTFSSSDFSINFEHEGLEASVHVSTDLYDVEVGAALRERTPFLISAKWFRSYNPAIALRFIAVNMLARKRWAFRALAILSCFSPKTIERRVEMMCEGDIGGYHPEGLQSLHRFYLNLSEYINDPRVISRAVRSLRKELEKPWYCDRRYAIEAFLKLVGGLDHPELQKLLLEGVLGELSK